MPCRRWKEESVRGASYTASYTAAYTAAYMAAYMASYTALQAAQGASPAAVQASRAFAARVARKRCGRSGFAQREGRGRRGTKLTGA